MYNRYIPQETSYTWVEPEYAKQKPEPTPDRGVKASRGSTRRCFSFLEDSGTDGGLSCIDAARSAIRGLWKRGSFDSGDLLLLLILLLLLKEGEDTELIVALGLALLIGGGGTAGECGENETGDG